MLYDLNMSFRTDGDFGWNIVPAGFNYDGDESYNFQQRFYDLDEAKKWVNKYINLLVGNLDCKDYIYDELTCVLFELKKSIVLGKEYSKYICGNYEIDVTFICTRDTVNLPIDKNLYTKLNESNIRINDIEKHLWNMVGDLNDNKIKK